MSRLPGRLSLADLLRRDGLEYDALDGALVVRFQSQLAEQLAVAAWLGGPKDEFVFIAAPLPEAPRRSTEQVLHNLLRVSFHAVFVKAAIWEEGRPVLVSVLPAPIVTPRVAGALVRGLACLADVDRATVSEAEGWQERLALYNVGVASSVDADVEDARMAVRGQAEHVGTAVLEGPQGSLVFGLGLAERELPVSACFAEHVTYFAAALGLGVSGGGRRGRLKGLLELNGSAVAKVGLNRKAELVLLYEVPAPPPDVFTDVQVQFSHLLRGIDDLMTG